MDYGDYDWGLYRDYYRDPYPHSLLRTRLRSLILLIVHLAVSGTSARALDPASSTLFHQDSIR